jgi:hypothetical protein
MANNLSNSGIVDGQVIFANQVNQIIDAFTGTEAYDIALSGSLTVTGSLLIGEIQNANGAVSSVLVRDNTTGAFFITGSYGGSGGGGSGSSGSSGTSGSRGTSGSSGSSGFSGSSGSNGLVGTSGSSGSLGTSGSRGTSGSTGTSGSSGFSNDISRATAVTHSFDTQIDNDSNYQWQVEFQANNIPSGNGKCCIGLTSPGSKNTSTFTFITFDNDSDTGDRSNTLKYLQEGGRIDIRSSAGSLLADTLVIREVDISNAGFTKVFVSVDSIGDNANISSGTNFRFDFDSDVRIPLLDQPWNRVILNNLASSAVGAVLSPNSAASFGDYNIVEFEAGATNNGALNMQYVFYSEGSTTTFNDSIRTLYFNNNGTLTAMTIDYTTYGQVGLAHFRVVDYANNSYNLIGTDKVF